MVAHSTLTGLDLHEVKGAAAASAQTVLIADGLGSAQFGLPTTLTNIQFSSTLMGSRSVDILPAVVDVPIAAPFDANASNADMSIDTAGTITINTTGVYFTTFNLNFGRTSAVGTAVVAARLLLNGTQFGFTQAVTMDDQLNSRPSQFNIIRAYTAGDVLQVQIMRDSSGINNGGLVATPITPGTWTDGPSYWFRGAKIVGAA